jgi:hypothetical protein
MQELIGAELSASLLKFDTEACKLFLTCAPSEFKPPELPQASGLGSAQFSARIWPARLHAQGVSAALFVLHVYPTVGPDLASLPRPCTLGLVNQINRACLLVKRFAVNTHLAQLHTPVGAP